MGTTGPAQSDRISIISINPLYFSHHKGTTIVLTVPKRKMLMFDLAGEVPMTHSSGGIRMQVDAKINPRQFLQDW